MDIPLPEAHAIAVLVLTGAALFLFSRDQIPLHTTSLFVMVALAIGFTLFPFQAADGELDVADFFYGFGHKALVAVCALMVCGHSLVRTGALEPVGRYLAKLWRRSPAVSLLATLLATAALSAFINNTPIVVMMLPLLIGVAVRNNTSPTGLLLPMGLASLVGGICTTIGTSTNLLVVAVAEDMGVAPFQMFDFLLPAGIAGLVAILYLWQIAPRMLPQRRPPMENVASRIFTGQLVLNPDSPVVGRTLAHAIDRTEGALQAEKIQREQGVFVTTLPDVVLRAGDRITTSDTPDQLREFSRLLGSTLYSGQHPVDDEHPLSGAGQKLAEVAITTASRLLGTRLNQAQLQRRYGIQFLALHRAEREESRRSRAIDEVELQVGDVLLVQATPQDLLTCKASGDFLVLDGSTELPHTRKAPLALTIMVAVIVTAAAGVMPIAVSALAGVMLMIATGCLNWRDVTGALSAQVILIVASSLALGMALMKTGGAAFLAQAFLVATFGMPPVIVLAGLMLLMAMLTNVVSNNAAAVIGTPIAIEIAGELGLPVEPFVLGVLFGANLSFVTPMAYQTNLLVMNAGGYKFNDFVRVGLPLMVLMWVALTGLLVYSYQLY